MTKIVLALFMTLNIVSIYGYVSGQKTCNTTISKFNEKVAKLVENSKNQTSEWAVFSDIQSLKGLGFALKYTCINETLEVVTTDTTQTPAELQACAKLQEIVESFLPKEGDAGYTGGDGKTDSLNKEIVSAGKSVGENCTITLVAKEVEEETEEEENEWAWNPTEEEDVLDAEGGWPVEEEEDDDEEEDSIQAQYINKYKPKNIEVESEDKEEEDEEDSIQAQYINKYKPKNVDIESEEEEDDEDSDLVTLNLISVNKKAKNDSGSQWTQGGYENYTNASQWQSGGYQKYYDQNKTTGSSSFLLGF